MAQNSLGALSAVPGPESWATPVAWVSTTAYTAKAPRSTVTYQGATYVAVTPSTGVTPGTDPATWAMIAAAGGVGPAGPTGRSVVGSSVDAANVLSFTLRDNVTNTNSTIVAGTVVGARQFRGIWSNSIAYSQGDVVSNLGALYQANADVAISATFPAASFTRVTTDLGSVAPSRAGLVLASNSTTSGDLSYSPVVSAIAGAWTPVTPTGSATAVTASPPAYRVIGDRVEVRGQFQNVSGGAGSAIALFTLPAGMRPVANEQYVCQTSQGPGQTVVAVDATGAVYVYDTSKALSSAYVNLSSIAFSVTTQAQGAPAYSSTFLTTQPTAWTAIPLGSGITATAGNPPQYRLNGDRVELRGSMNGASAGANGLSQTLGTLPLGARPYTDVLAVGFNGATVSPIGINISAAGVMQTYANYAVNNGSIVLAGIDFSVSTSNTVAPTGVVGSAWTALPLSAGSAGPVAPMYRIVGDEVQLRGYVAGLSGGSTASPIATLPAGYRPPAEVLVPLATGVGAPVQGNVTTAGVVGVFWNQTFSGLAVSLYTVRFSITA